MNMFCCINLDYSSMFEFDIGISVKGVLQNHKAGK